MDLWRSSEIPMNVCGFHLTPSSSQSSHPSVRCYNDKTNIVWHHWMYKTTNPSDGFSYALTIFTWNLTNVTIKTNTTFICMEWSTIIMYPKGLKWIQSQKDEPEILDHISPAEIKFIILFCEHRKRHIFFME